MAQVYIGTSGWQYPDFEEKFYPQDLPKKDQLGYYAQEFSTVEINNTFYQLPKEATIHQWVSQVPDNFVFAIKASRYITHLKNLLEPEESLPKFIDRIKVFGHFAGPILFQLPTLWQVDSTRLYTFLEHLPGDYRYAIEFRNQSWFESEVIDFLKEFNVAFCIYDFNYRQSPVLTTSDFVYIRLHGPGQPYHDLYDLDALKRWADWINTWTQESKDVYFYFDNTYQGHAWENAKTLQSLVHQ